MEWTFVFIVVALLVGFILGRASKSGKTEDRGVDGYLDVSAEDTSKIYQFEINTEPEALRTQKSVTFEVRKIPSTS